MEDISISPLAETAKKHGKMILTTLGEPDKRETDK
jgi:hypothetical protein